MFDCSQYLIAIQTTFQTYELIISKAIKFLGRPYFRNSCFGQLLSTGVDDMGLLPSTKLVLTFEHS